MFGVTNLEVVLGICYSIIIFFFKYVFNFRITFEDPLDDSVGYVDHFFFHFSFKSDCTNLNCKEYLKHHGHIKKHSPGCIQRFHHINLLDQF